MFLFSVTDITNKYYKRVALKSFFRKYLISKEGEKMSHSNDFNTGIRNQPTVSAERGPASTALVGAAAAAALIT